MTTPKDKARQGVVVGMGALTGSSQPVPRYDIDDLMMKNPDGFNLFLQAMSLLQKDKNNLGFFGMAGIHGFPTSTWDGVGKEYEDDYGGYCAHGVLIFPTWHRPYLALFEQTIYLKMVEIAMGYRTQHQSRYLDAAKKWRLPYLDYFRPRGGRVSFPGIGQDGQTTSFQYNFRLPDIFNERSVFIKFAPDDDSRAMENPLYQFKFNSTNGELSTQDRGRLKSLDGFFPIKQTVRYPANANSDTHNLRSLSWALNNGREGRAAFLLDLLNSTPYSTLEAVASDQPPASAKLATGDMTEAEGIDKNDPQNPMGSGSLEGTLHGGYHNIIGGFSSEVAGHMTHPSVAAFDPVFWFHHCNIDRIWALWQAMHPQSWFPKAKAGGKAENTKDLFPFYKTRAGPGKGTYYNSDDSKTTEAFGYVYDDFDDIKSTDRRKVGEYMVQKYAWASRFPNDPNFRAPPAKMAPLPVRTTQFFQQTSNLEATAFTHEATPKDSGNVASLAAAAAAPVVAGAQAVMSGISNTVSSAFVPTKVDPNFDREWYVDVQVQRAAANGTFTIYFFLSKPGELTTNVEEFIFSPFLAGFTHVFASSREFCDNCGNTEAAGQLMSDTSNITAILLDYMARPTNGFDSLKPESVRPFLIEHLRWRVVYHAINVQDPRNVPDLHVGVSAKISHDDGTKTYENYPDIVQTILGNASSNAGT